jgi:ribonuclease HII
MTGHPSLEMERELWREGMGLVAGVDEAGRGCLAGPVMAAAVVLPPFPSFPWLALVRDSKALSPRSREELWAHIRREALMVAVAQVPPEEIDRVGIHVASLTAMAQAVASLPSLPQAVLVDGPWALPGLRCRQVPLVGGDARSLSVACASIVAKVERDRLMAELDALYPGYGFRRHKGYGTSAHWEAVRRLGPSPIHRLSFLEGRGDRALGRQAEEAAVAYLAALGWEVLERNRRTPEGEIDVVARDGHELVFVEVKGRRSEAMGTPAEAITPRKRRRLVRAVLSYMQETGCQAQPRIDVVLVRLGRGGQVLGLEHLRGAVEGP